MCKKVIILGGEGNGGVIASAIIDMNKKGYYEYEFEGYLNDFEKPGTLIHNYPVLGKLKEVHDFAEKGYYFMWAVHMVGHGKKRQNLFNDLAIPEDKLAKIVHPNAFIAYNVILEQGVFVMANSYIGPGTIIRKGTLIMANCVVGHNDEIGELCHLSAGCNVSSYVKIGNVSDIGLGASVLEKKIIGKYSVVGANSLLTKDIGDSVIYVGSPARFHRKIEE
jgi:acetyltransferase EpsM